MSHGQLTTQALATRTAEKIFQRYFGGAREPAGSRRSCRPTTRGPRPSSRGL
jgi:hypothetical protein